MKDQAEFPDLANFALRLKEARKASRCNQTDFAALGGVGLGSQSRYEKGETAPGVNYLMLLGANEIDVGYLLTGRHTSDSLDQETSAIVSSVRRLAGDQRRSLLAFLATIVPDSSDTD
ncbi:helix-turn-helix domain-containing protein [Sphingomonas sp. Leaf62]|uniref:helix-turn-helix domain-containing protein n=1 Tax=Sphingomonas sp. Leaf62 TaxID=1736228 RepID=UPI000ABD3A3B|nr:helix-turn-helix transcriptional regulator [Sphingomonas sp. Leaf62]